MKKHLRNLVRVNAAKARKAFTNTEIKTIVLFLSFKKAER